MAALGIVSGGGAVATNAAAPIAKKRPSLSTLALSDIISTRANSTTTITQTEATGGSANPSGAGQETLKSPNSIDTTGRIGYGK